MRFGCVRTDLDRKHNAISSGYSLFEVKVAATIEANDIKGLNKDDCRMACDGNTEFLSVAAGHDLNLFSTKDLSLISQCSSDSNILGIHTFHAKEPMALVVSAMQIKIFVGSLSDQPVLAFDHSLISSNSKECFLASRVIKGACHIVVVFSQNAGLRIVVPMWEQLIYADKENFLALANKAMSQLTREKFNIPLNICGFKITECGGLIFIPRQCDSALYLSSTIKNQLNTLFDFETPPRLLCGYPGGTFWAVIDSLNELLIIDGLSLSIIHKIKLVIDGDVEDFYVINDSPTTFFFDQIVVTLRRSSGSFMEIYSVISKKIIFSAPVREGAHLLPGGDESKRILVLAEPFDNEYPISQEGVLQISELIQVHPQACLDRMLAHEQFTSAIEFARKHNLDEQQVYVSQIRHLAETFSHTVEKKDVQNFLIVCDKVKNKETVAEFCIVAACRVENPYLVAEILDYCNLFQIQDPNTSCSLEDIRYSLATFRLVLGDYCDIDAASEIWQKFLQEGELINVFTKFLLNGLMSEARMIWARHQSKLLQDFQLSEEISRDSVEVASFIELVFSHTRQGINVKNSCWREALSLLEVELINSLQVEQKIEAFKLLWQLVEWLIPFLEIHEPANFPNNALYAAGTLHRAINDNVDEAITPFLLAKSVFTSRCFAAIDGDKPKLLGVATKVVQQLEDINELKTKFNCLLSFTEFTSMTTEDICYKILDQSLSNPAKLKDNVASYARPYMKKRNLPIDNTLFEYIKRQSYLMAAANSSNVWGQYCLIVTEAIENLHIRHRAILEVARLSQVPWNPALRKAVDSVLNDKQANSKLQEELKRLCLRVEMALLLRKYNLSTDFERINDYLSTTISFEKILKFICADASNNIQIQITDAQKIIELYNQLNERSPFPVWRVSIHFCEALFSKLQDNFSQVIDYLSSMEARGNQIILDELISSISSHLEIQINHSSKYQLELRLKQLRTLESLITRFRKDVGFYVNLANDVRSLRILQEKYAICETLLFMRSSVERINQLRHFLEVELAKEEFNIEKVLDFAMLLNFSADAALCLMFEANTNLRDPDLALILISKAITKVYPFSTRLSNFCLEAIDLILLAIFYSSKSDNQDQLDRILQWGVTLQRKIPELCLAGEHSLDIYDAIFRVNGYLQLIVAVFLQGSSDESLNEKAAQSESKEKLTSALGDTSQWTHQTQRLGFYNFTSDAALYEKIQTVQILGNVARSIIRMQGPKNEALFFEMNNDWEQLFSHLSLHNQHLLEYSARVYSSFLPCFENTHMDVVPSVQMIVQKVIDSHPADLWTAIQVLMTIPISKMQNLTIRELKNFTRSQQNPQSHINYCRIAQFMTAICGQASEYQINLTSTFRKALWQKKLRKMGLPTNICTYASGRTDLMLSSFANSLTDSRIVSKFLLDFGLSSTLLLQYGATLFYRASTEVDDKTVKESLENALLSIEISGNDDESCFSVLLDTLYILSPYNYEVIAVLLAKLDELSFTESHFTITKPLKAVLKFLTSQARRQEVTKVEYFWFEERERYFESILKEKNTTIHELSALVHSRYCKGPNLDETNPVIDEVSAQLNEELFKKLPANAKRRLPFHLLLYQNSDDIRRFLKPTIELEINIYSLTGWQELASSVNYLLGSISRMELLKIAVCKSARQAVMEEELTEADSERILTCTVSNSNRADVITVLSTCVQSMKTIELKLSFLRLALNVGQAWIDRKDHYNIKPTEEIELRGKITSIELMIVRMETERLLSSSQISKPHILIDNNPERLIEHIYLECVNWNDAEDVEKKYDVVTKLALINNIDLHTIEARLISEWLQEKKAEVPIDLNNTVDLNISAPLDMHPGNLIKSSSQLPVFDVTTTRIARVIRKGDLPTYAAQLGQIINKSDFSSASCQRRLLALCVVAITFDDNELLLYFKSDNNSLGTQIEITAYMKLFGLAAIDMDLKKFSEAERIPLVRQLIDNSRPSQESTELAACLILDEEFEEKEYVEKVAERLLRFGSTKLLSLLLQHCANLINLHLVRNLPLLWKRVFESRLAALEGMQDQNLIDRYLQKSLYMLFACPVSGGRSFEAVRSLLGHHKLYHASFLVSLLVVATKKLEMDGLKSTNPNRDLNFEWISQQTSLRANNSIEEVMDM